LKRVARVLGLAMVLTALLVVSISGTVFAADGNGPSGPNGDCELPGPYGPNAP